MDLTHSTDLTTVTSESYISGSKSTDFIKPKDSSNNLEAQNQGEFIYFGIFWIFILICWLNLFSEFICYSNWLKPPCTYKKKTHNTKFIAPNDMDSIFLHALHSLPQCLDLSDLTVRIVAYIIESNTYAKIWVSFCLIVNHFQPLIYSEFSLLALNLSTFQTIPNNLNSHKFNTFKWASGRAKNESFDFHSIAWKIEGKIKKPTKTVLFICILVNVDELKV